jgi:replicative DNA helicase
MPVVETGVRPKLWRAEDILAEWERDAIAAHNAVQRRQPRGPVTGFRKLDQALGGWLQQGLHMVLAQPGVGKTAFALQVAASCGFPALFVTCELSVLELARRVVARVENVPASKLKSGELEPAVSVTMARSGLATCPELALVDATRDYVAPDSLRDAALQARGSAEHVLIVLDSLQSWAEMCQARSSEYERLNAALLDLRSVTSELRCPAIVISERNRQAMQVGGMSAGAGTRRIEYVAETILDLEGPEDSKGASVNGETAIVLRIVKNRHGAAGTPTRMRFTGALLRFEETR